MFKIIRIIRYIMKMKGKCSWLEYQVPCNRWAVRFERLDGEDFSISCKAHH